MTVKSIEEIIIYESPDGGKTVYSRKSGSPEREMIKVPPEDKVANRWLNLKQAVIMAQDDKTMDDALQRVEILLELKK